VLEMKKMRGRCRAVFVERKNFPHKCDGHASWCLLCIFRLAAELLPEGLNTTLSPRIPKRTPTNQTRGQGSFSFILSLRASLLSVGIPSWREVFDWNLKGLFTM
jgi:hypothetical protein